MAGTVDIAQLAASVNVTDSASAVLDKVNQKLHGTAEVATGQVSPAVDEVGRRSQRMSLQGVGAFSSLQGALSAAGNPLGPLNEGLSTTMGMLYGAQNLSEGFGRKAFIAGGALMGIGAIATKLGGDLAKSQGMLDQAIENTGSHTAQWNDQIQQAVDKGAHLGKSHAEVNEALSRLTIGFGSAGMALADLNGVEDLAATKHISLVQASKEVIRSYEGYARGAKELGINMTMTHTASKGLEAAHTAEATAVKALDGAQLSLLGVQQKLNDGRLKGAAGQDALAAAQLRVLAANDKVVQSHKKVADAEAAVAHEATQGQAIVSAIFDKAKGQAEAQANTLGGHIDSIKAHIVNFLAESGKTWGPAATAIGALAAGAGAAAPGIAAMGRGVVDLGKSLGGMIASVYKASAAFFEMALAEDSVLWPILAIAAVIAIVIAAAYLLWTNWDKVWNWIKDHPAIAIIISILAAPIAAFVLIIGALHWLYQNWRQVWSTIQQVIEAVWKRIAPLIHSFGQMFTDVVGIIKAIINGDFSGALNKLWQLVKDAFTNAWEAIKLAVSLWLDYLREVPGRIINLLSDLADKLTGWAMDAFNAAWHAMMSVVGDILAWVGGVPRMILDAIKDLGGILEHIGERIMNGLWNGMKSIWHDIEGWLGGLGDFITSLKGPPEVDAVLLYDNGTLIMQGFHRGLKDEWANVQTTLSGYTAQLAGTFQKVNMDVGGGLSVSGGGAAREVHHHVHVVVQGSVVTERELHEVIRDNLIRMTDTGGGAAITIGN